MKKKLTLLLTTYFLSFAFAFSQTAPGIEWQKSYGGTLNDNATSIALTTDGGYIVAGYAWSNDMDITNHHGSTMYSDYWVVKIDSAGNIQWQKSLGGTQNDWAFCVIQTLDGGYAVAGQSTSNDDDVSGHHGTFLYWDSWIAKLDGLGNLMWQKSLGSTGHESITSIFQLADSSYVFTGRAAANNGDVTGNHGYDDFWIVKLNVTGNILWQKCFGGSYPDVPLHMMITSDGGFVIAGQTSSNDSDVTGNHCTGSSCQFDYWIIKLDSLANMQWQKTLGGYNSDAAFSVIQTIDNGYLVAGFAISSDGDITNHFGQTNFWIVKLDSAGNLLWQKSFGGSLAEVPHHVIQTFNGDYLIAGSTTSTDNDVTGNHGSNDIWIIRIDSTGNLLWQKCYGGSQSEELYKFKLTPDGGYILAGSSRSIDGDATANHGLYDYWIIKLAPDTITSIFNPQSSNFNINISPNPFSNEFTVSGLQFPVVLKLFDVFGKEVLSQPLLTVNTKLQTANLAKGVYFLKAGSQIKKVVKVE